MRHFHKILTVALSLIICIGSISFSKSKPKVLVFSKTTGFRHASIADGKLALLKMGAENGFEADTTEDASWFTEEKLKKYSAVIFLSTTGNVLDTVQQAEFERYIQAGGNYIGIHAATDTEYDWPWYNKLAGAQFLSHPKIQSATVHVTDKEHTSTTPLPADWTRTDEWYNFKNINPALHVLIQLDEKTYEGGKNGGDHPIAWCHSFDGGRAFYTGFGHTKESWTETLFLEHLLGGIRYAVGERNKLDYKKATTQRIR